MLELIVVILLVLWLLGLISHVGGDLIHALAVIAFVLIILRLFRGQSV